MAHRRLPNPICRRRDPRPSAKSVASFIFFVFIRFRTHVYDRNTLSSFPAKLLRTTFIATEGWGTLFCSESESITLTAPTTRRNKGPYSAWRLSIVNRGLDVRGSVPVQAGGGNGLRKNDADRNKDSSRARSKRYSHFHARTFGILIAAAKADSAF